jgi:hypothetical protein
MSYDQKAPTVWVKKITLNESTELGVSEKGYIGIWSRGRWQGGLTAATLTLLIDRAEDAMSLAAIGLELSDSGKEASKKARMDAKLLKEAEALKAKAFQLAQAGVDMTAILNLRKEA